jgi:hypothetical protein
MELVTPREVCLRGLWWSRLSESNRRPSHYEEERHRRIGPLRPVLVTRSRAVRARFPMRIRRFVPRVMPRRTTYRLHTRPRSTVGCSNMQLTGFAGGVCLRSGGLNGAQSNDNRPQHMDPRGLPATAGRSLGRSHVSKSHLHVISGVLSTLPRRPGRADGRWNGFLGGDDPSQRERCR